MLIDGVKINENNYTYIKAMRRGLPIPGALEDTRPWTIRVCFLDGTYTNIGNYSTQGIANKVIQESK